MPIGIFHLVRKANGPAPFRAFVASLRRNMPNRSDWQLVLVLKGFDADPEARRYLDEVRDLDPAHVHVSDRGFDIGAYFKAAAATAYATVGFFNSFCELQTPEWLDLLAHEHARPGVGLVGTTGSLESVVRNHMIYGERAHALTTKVTKYAIAVGLRALFPPFPNAHVRTNAFMIDRARFLKTRRYPVTGRMHSLFYESGWLSLTRQIQSQGLDVRIVDRNGHSLAPHEWEDSGIFRSGAQDQGIVTDNRVREYANATPERQRELRLLAWGG